LIVRIVEHYTDRCLLGAIHRAAKLQLGERRKIMRSIRGSPCSASSATGLGAMALKGKRMASVDFSF
jgi:hypothetical protein